MSVVPLLLSAQLITSPQYDAQLLTLAAAVAQARAESPVRNGAAELTAAARDAVPAAGRMLNPLFELRTENWTTHSSAVTPSLDVFAVGTQVVELGGKRSLRRSIAEADATVAALSLRSLDRTIVIDTVHAYVRALRSRALLATLTENRDSLGAVVTTVSRRVAEGFSAEADLLKFTTEAARVDGDIVRARLELERALSALAVTIGRKTPLTAEQLVEPPPLAPPSADVASIAARVAQHPEVLAADARVIASGQIAALERARRLPDAAVSAGYKRTAGFDTLVLGVNLVVPLFDRNTAATIKAAGAERAAAAGRAALVNRLQADAVSLLTAAAALTERARRAEPELLIPAEQVRTAARTSFREGSADVLKLIDAERVWADAHRAAIDLRLDALLATVEARLALGEEAIP